MLLEHLFEQGDDVAGALLVVGEGRDPVVGSGVGIFIGARRIQGTAQIGALALVELDEHAQDGGQAVTGAGKHTDDAQTADFRRAIEAAIAASV